MNFKNYLIICYYFFCSALFLGASPKWLTDIEKEFPTKNYIRAVGEGENESLAKKSALSELSAYFTQTINTEIQSTKKLSKSDSEYHERAEISQKMTIEASSELFSVHYTQSYFDKRQKTYFICAYINKSEFWEILFLRMKNVIKVYDELIQKSNEENELLQKIIYLNKAENFFTEFNSLYSKALVVYPEKCKQFDNFIDSSISTLSNLSTLRKKVSIQIIINNDKDNKIKAKISEVLSNNKLSISSKKGMYKLKARIIWNELENEASKIYSSSPQIDLKIIGENRTLISFSKKCEKIATKKADTTERIAISKLENLIEEHLIQECLK